jgi:aminotransferase
MFSKKISQLEVSAIKQIEIEASKLRNVVSLAQGIPSFDTPEPIKRKVKEALDKGLVAKYSLPQGLPILREAISEYLRGQDIYIDYDEELIITAGATEGIIASLLTIINHGDEVILVSPSYASYREYIKVAEGFPRYVALNENDNWSLDTEKIKKAFNKKTKAILLCNPNIQREQFLLKNN